MTSKILKGGSEFLGGYGVAFRRGGKGKLPDLKIALESKKEGRDRRKGESWLVEDISDALTIFSGPLGYMGTPIPRSNHPETS